MCVATVAGTVWHHVLKCEANVGAMLSAAGVWNIDIRYVVMRIWRCLDGLEKMAAAKVGQEQSSKKQ